MKLNFKNVLFSVGILAIALFGFSTHKAEAATIVSNATGGGTWATGATWAGGIAPVAGDNVTIAAGDTVTVAASASTTNLLINAATSKLVISSGQTLTVSGTFTNNGTTTNGVNGPGTLLFTGTASIAGAFTSTTLPNVTVGDGVSTNTVTISGATSMVDLTVATGATLTNSTYTVGISGNLSKNGTLTAGSDVYTMSGTSKTISGILSIPSLTITGTVTNNGILTVGTALAGAGTLTQGSNSVLNISGTSATFTLTASATGNTVSYISASGQAVKVPSGHYYNLGFSGGGVKTIPSTIIIDNNTIVEAGTYMILSNGGVSTSHVLKIAGLFKANNTWGGTSSSAVYKDGTYFTTTATGTIAPAVGYNGTPPVAVVTNPEITIITCTLPQVLDITSNTCITPETPEVTITVTPATEKVTCSEGQKFDTVTGKACTEFTSATPEVPATPATSAVLKFTKSLTAKSVLADVKNLQTALNSIAGTTLTVDGKWGKLTTAAVKKFQTANKLTADGKFGPKSLVKLNALLGL